MDQGLLCPGGRRLVSQHQIGADTPAWCDGIPAVVTCRRNRPVATAWRHPDTHPPRRQQMSEGRLDHLTALLERNNDCHAACISALQCVKCDQRDFGSFDGAGAVTCHGFACCFLLLEAAPRFAIPGSSLLFDSGDSPDDLKVQACVVPRGKSACDAVRVRPDRHLTRHVKNFGRLR